MGIHVNPSIIKGMSISKFQKGKIFYTRLLILFMNHGGLENIGIREQERKPVDISMKAREIPHSHSIPFTVECIMISFVRKEHDGNYWPRAT